MQRIVGLTVPCIKSIVTCHFEILFRDMLDEQLNKIEGRKSLPDKGIIFMPVVMKGYVIPIVGINPGEGNDRTAKVAADVFDNGFRITKVRFCVNIKTIFIFTE